MPPSRLLPCMAAPVPNSWKARCFSSMVPETHLATPSRDGWSAIFTGILPRTAMALSRFDPMTAPIPVRPATSFSSLAMQAKRSEEHTSELQSRLHLVCRLLLEKKKKAKERDRRVAYMPQQAHTV